MIITNVTSPMLLNSIKLKANNDSKFKSLTQSSLAIKNDIYSLRHKAHTRKINTNDKIKAFLGSAIATVLTMSLISKKQKIKNPFLIHYSPKEMITLSAASIIGGVGFGMIKEDNKTRVNRVKEGIFQFLNASIPVLMTSFTLAICEKNNKLNNPQTKILATTLGIASGVVCASKLSNKITDPNNKEPDRKTTIKDSIANIDDFFAALALAKIPIVKNLKIERILPLIYTLCGTRAGESN